MERDFVVCVFAACSYRVAHTGRVSGSIILSKLMVPITNLAQHCLPGIPLGPASVPVPTDARDRNGNMDTTATTAVIGSIIAGAGSGEEYLSCILFPFLHGCLTITPFH